MIMPKRTVFELAVEKLMLKYTQVVDRSSSWCANCRVNIANASEQATCERCGVEWHYVATSARIDNHEESKAHLATIRPSLVYIGWVEMRDPRFREDENDPCARIVELFT